MSKPKRKRCPSQGKLIYPTQRDAIRAALSYSRKRGTPLRPYHHADCHGWHLTSQPLNRSQVDNQQETE